MFTFNGEPLWIGCVQALIHERTLKLIKTIEKMKKVPSAKILDKLHRGVVITCIGLTLYGTALIGHRAYRYLTVIKPERADRELKMLEVKLFVIKSIL